MIREVRDICDTFASRGLPNFPHGIPFTFWGACTRSSWQPIII